MKNDITMSSLDVDRIDTLLDNIPPSPAGDALLDEIARATILEPGEMPPRVVTMNSRVRFTLNGAHEELHRTLVYPKDCGRGDDALSVLTPVGSALLGLAEGDAIEWVHPDGNRIVVRVLEVMYQPERSGDFHL